MFKNIYLQIKKVWNGSNLPIIFVKLYDYILVKKTLFMIKIFFYKI